LLPERDDRDPHVRVASVAGGRPGVAGRMDVRPGGPSGGFSRVSWVRAFARQACSDFDAWDCLCRSAAVDQCQRLHALQMALEKAAKAHLIATGVDPMAIQSSHAYIAKHIPRIVASELGRARGVDSRWVMLAVRKLARRIDLLH